MLQLLQIADTYLMVVAMQYTKAGLYLIDQSLSLLLHECQNGLVSDKTKQKYHIEWSNAYTRL